ncbi:MAG TPA: hypothetical protein DC052_13225, partial [Pseudomonas sp.]|nr:hypothetical protein [Pseudomonas sp.]
RAVQRIQVSCGRNNAQPS